MTNETFANINLINDAKYVCKYLNDVDDDDSINVHEYIIEIERIHDNILRSLIFNINDVSCIDQHNVDELYLRTLCETSFIMYNALNDCDVIEYSMRVENTYNDDFTKMTLMIKCTMIEYQ